MGSPKVGYWQNTRTHTKTYHRAYQNTRNTNYLLSLFLSLSLSFYNSILEFYRNSTELAFLRIMKKNPNRTRKQTQMSNYQQNTAWTQMPSPLLQHTHTFPNSKDQLLPSDRKPECPLIKPTKPGSHVYRPTPTAVIHNADTHTQYAPNATCCTHVPIARLSLSRRERNRKNGPRF